ncbi:hypothetical protein K2173_015792 [Erythroxylum novogranatense]|uniref:DUF4283 domain-containing protein n=1 Tax=Erythroxylum novogranatense TaxID=1862640 RepID=A0AAV8TGH7_9ROSI|nr:hypothetical protein K2173_015792 [Erythroxylum novogranatense]
MADDRVSASLANLSVDSAPDDGLVYGSDDLVTTDDAQLCLVGRFLTDKAINFHAMRHTLASVWQPLMGMQVREVKTGLYVFQFFHAVDVHRILDMRPCTFDNHLLILDRFGVSSSPFAVPLYHVPFWIQVHGLPSGFRSARVLQDIGNKIGQFLELDPTNFERSWNSYLRMRVSWDVRRPLREGFKLRHDKGDWFTVGFTYERLPSFCFLCGLLSHTERFCPTLLDFAPGQAVRRFSASLRALSRWEQRNIGDRVRWCHPLSLLAVVHLSTLQPLVV